MRTFFVQLVRELRSIFHTPVAYVVIAFFAGLMGFNFQMFVSLLNKQPAEVMILDVVFYNGLFIFVFAFIAALITMRSFAEEFRLGTVEMLMTAPVKDWHVVLAKFFGASIFFAILLMPTAACFWVFDIVTHGAPAARSVGAIASAYILLLMLGMLFISIGVFASSLVRDQVNAAVITLAVTILYLFIPMAAERLLNITDPRVKEVYEFFDPLQHIVDFSKGVVDTRRIVWYLSATGLFVFLTHHIFHSRKLKAS